MIQCDDECPPQPWLGPALVGLVGTIAAAAVGPLVETWREGRKQRRRNAERLARLEERANVPEESEDE